MPVDFAGTSFEKFVDASRRVNSPLSESAYEDHVRRLNSSMEHELAAQIDANKTAILNLFPFLVRPILAASWWAMSRIGTIVAAALVAVVLYYLASKTVEEVAELILRYRNRTGNTNPFPVGVVRPK